MCAVSFRFRLDLLVLCLLIFGAPLQAADVSGMRRETALDDGWRFQFAAAGASISPDFDDQAWERVTLPHTWNVGDGTTRGYRRGPGWYRRRFSAPPLRPGERVYVEFRGVTLVSTVWLNGVCLGTHDNGFSAFRLDATDALRRDRDNVLVVLADTTRRDDVPPLEGDFTIFGGICRRVSLVVTPAIAIDRLDHGGPGVYLDTRDVTADSATVAARVLVRNTTGGGRSMGVRLVLRNAAGTTVADQRVEHVALPGASEARLEVCLDRPRRWHGRRDPHVYRASVTLLEGDTVLDAVEQPLGVRAVAIDRQRGFLLNGEPYDLRGVNLHQDLEGRGWAMSRADRERDFQLMLDMGCTFVRLAHYQHDADVYELADRLGLVVWTEHAFVNRAGRSPRFAERCSLHLRELIRQNFNHPSVAFWGIGNEVQTHEGPARTILEQLAREVRLEDPSRLSTLATNYAEPVGAYGLDSIAHNQYHGWYHSTPEAFAGWIDQQRAKTPGESLGMSEYGAGAGVSIHRAAPARMDHSEEYQAYFHEIYWRTLRERPWVWCKAVWVMFDFASAGRDEGEAPGINDKGLVSRDRQVRKDAYFWYQANWTDKPMVHITGRRFNPRTTEMVEVKAYSNCTSAELRLNGEVIGTVAVNDAMARWPAVKLRAGRNVVEVTARRGDSLVSDRCEWTLTPAP